MFLSTLYHHTFLLPLVLLWYWSFLQFFVLFYCVLVFYFTFLGRKSLPKSATNWIVVFRFPFGIGCNWQNLMSFLHNKKKTKWNVWKSFFRNPAEYEKLVMILCCKVFVHFRKNCLKHLSRVFLQCVRLCVCVWYRAVSLIFQIEFNFSVGSKPRKSIPAPPPPPLLL